MRAPGQVVVDGRKPCSVCKQVLDVIAFGKSSASPTGLAHACKACVKAKRDEKHVSVPRTTAILVVDGKKPCSACRRLLPVSEFGKDSNTPTGLSYACRDCANTKTRNRRDAEKAKDPDGFLARQRTTAQAWRDGATPELRKTRGRRQLFKARGVTAEWFEETLAAQGGVCAICRLPESKLSSGGGLKMLAIDHDHTTGKARGLICQQCNIGIGALQDSPDLIRRAVRYLLERKWESVGAGFENS